MCKYVPSGGHWNSNPRPIILQRRHKSDGSRQKQQRVRLKERLEEVIVQHEQIADEIERTSEPNPDETAALSSETIGR